MRGRGLSITTQQVICSEAGTANVLHGTSHLLTVFRCDHEDVVRDQPVPVAQDALDGFQQQVAPEEQEVEAGHQVAHAKDADAGRPGDEDDSDKQR